MNAVASQSPEQASVFAATLLTKFVILDFNRVSCLPRLSLSHLLFVLFFFWIVFPFIKPCRVSLSHPLWQYIFCFYSSYLISFSVNMKPYTFFCFSHRGAGAAGSTPKLCTLSWRFGAIENNVLILIFVCGEHLWKSIFWQMQIVINNTNSTNQWLND